MNKVVLLAENTSLLIASCILILFTHLLNILKLDITTAGIIIGILTNILFLTYSVILFLVYNIEKKDLNVDKDNLKNLKLMMIAYFFLQFI
ncbi:hypothetical protein [Clostridium fallax]|uniref:Uncharacterized protein n=1 Tax=Clostridium fallax TaxID=1533 RepID=A0A1M4ZLY6_9CLOT|nr:hypothetical protein [Clostridium fallax]SHF18807.1 hypothetical protein SAMN05443638_1571 [Clostridium fallax]SQB07513.1 Uncharacterised protein [Clostridium fallax]